MWPPNNGNLPPTLTITTQIIHGMRFNIIFYIMPVSVFFKEITTTPPQKNEIFTFLSQKSQFRPPPP